MTKVYNVRNTAEILCISQRRVRQLADEGVIPQVGNGWFKLLPAVQGYIRYLQGGNSDETHRHEKAALVRLKAERERLELQEKQRELHNTRDVELFVSNALVAFKTKLLALPHTVLPALLAAQEGEDYANVAVEILREAVERALAEFSELAAESKIGGHGDEPEHGQTF